MGGRDAVLLWSISLGFPIAPHEFRTIATLRNLFSSAQKKGDDFDSRGSGIRGGGARNAAFHGATSSDFSHVSHSGPIPLVIFEFVPFLSLREEDGKRTLCAFVTFSD